MAVPSAYSSLNSFFIFFISPDIWYALDYVHRMSFQTIETFFPYHVLPNHWKPLSEIYQEEEKEKSPWKPKFSALWRQPFVCLWLTRKKGARCYWQSSMIYPHTPIFLLFSNFIDHLDAFFLLLICYQLIVSIF